MSSQNIAYLRVSSVDQSLARQKEGMKEVVLDREFTDKASAKDTDRPQLQECIDYCRDGDTLHVYSIDRIASNLKDLQGNRYPSIAKSWNTHWENVITLFSYPNEIRKIIYTTNAIESLNSVIRKAIKKRCIFPNDTSAFKVVYLAIQKASEKWTMPTRNWKPAMNRFLIEYEDRFSEI